MQIREWDHPEPLFAEERLGRTCWCLAGCLLLTVLLIPSDIFFAREITQASRAWKSLMELPVISEFVGDGFGAIMILTAVGLADLRRRRFLLSTILIVFGAGVTANLIKLLTVRLRPRVVNLQEIDGWATFLGPGKLLDVYKHDLSFPSGHTTAAFALAYVMSRYYPRGRPMFLFLAVCAGLGRVVVRAHYPSDIVMGGIVGWGFAMLASHFLLVEGAEPRTWLAQWSRILRKPGDLPSDQLTATEAQPEQTPNSDRTAA